MSESLMKCRKRMDVIKTGVLSLLRDEARKKPAYCPSGDRHKDGVSPAQALVRNVGTCCLDAKGEIQVGGPHKDESTEAGHRGGAARIRDEGSVMELDQRGCIVQLFFWGQPVTGGTP